MMLPLGVLWLQTALVAVAVASASFSNFSINATNTLDMYSSALHGTLSFENDYTANLSILAVRGQNATFPQSKTSLLLPMVGLTPQQINSTTIIYISCDASDYQQAGSGSPAYYYTMAANEGAAAILLASGVDSACTILGTPEPAEYQAVWTLDQATTKSGFTLLDLEQVPTIASAGPNAINFNQSNFANLYANLTGEPVNNSNTNWHNGPAVNTQIAMIVLYTITGLVSVLFIIVILAGGVRAHRHPERYGPRAGFGPGGQTRAGGLARAMLDSLPIVKFGNSVPAKQVDTELGSVDKAPDSPVVHKGFAAETHTDTPGVSPEQSPEIDSHSIRSGIGPATVVTEQAKSETLEVPNCSICTDDFEAGQDMRVLPCQHKFHPECVDPWLVNVSGTCPMCRINLNPEEADEEELTERERFEMNILGQTISSRRRSRRDAQDGLAGSEEQRASFAEVYGAQFLRPLVLDRIRRMRNRNSVHSNAGGPAAAAGEQTAPAQAEAGNVAALTREDREHSPSA